MDNLYSSYETWKGWGETFVYSEDDAEYFVGETRGYKLNDADVLEIGFGSGSFLAWARSRGARIAGTEINKKLLDAAKEYGVEILPQDFETLEDAYGNRFDFIAAFDVFEHFSVHEINERLTAIEKMLRPGGSLILRFPNAQSPFGLAPQNGDPTHRSALSRSVFEQLIQTCNLESPDTIQHSGS